MKLSHLVFTLCALLSSAIASAADMGSALKDDKLRAEPYVDAKIAGDIKRGDTLEIISKQGAWLNIKTSKAKGWVRLLSVKRGASSTNTSSASDALKVASGRAGTGNVVATTGVRGLSAEELKGAKMNEADIKTLESYTLSKEEGQQFANSGGLKAISFSTLKEAKGDK